MGWANHDPEMIKLLRAGDKAELLSLIKEALDLWHKAHKEGTDGDAFYDLHVVLHQIDLKVKEVLK